jgi:hypothetical protein
VACESTSASLREKDDTRGIMGRACADILAKMAEIKDRTVEIKVQFYEMRQELIHDLLLFDTLDNLKGFITFS